MRYSFYYYVMNIYILFHAVCKRKGINEITLQPQILEAHNFRGLALSEISRKQFLRIKDSVSINTHGIFNFRG